MLSPPRPPRLPVAVAGAVLALVTACDEPVLLVVEVGLDYGTCNTSDPRQIVLGCSSIAGAWVRDGDGDILDQECVGLDTGQPLSDIRTVYAGMDLNADSGTRVTVDVALFSRPPGADCVPPDELAPEDRPEVIFAGSGRSEKLTGSRGPVEVFVDCTQTPERDVAEACHLVCAGILTECESGGASQVCQQERDDCAAGCDDDACRDACAGTYEACLEESIEGACRLTNERCIEAGEQTDVECNGDYFDCVDDGCGDEHVACFVACPSPGCALFPDRP
jgi:hypothetical protein